MLGPPLADWGVFPFVAESREFEEPETVLVLESGKITFGVMFKNILKPTLLTTSAASRMSVHRERLLLARKSSINLVPILYPLIVRKSPNIHFIKLVVDLLEILVVLDKLDDQCAIGKSKNFTVLDASYNTYLPL